MSNLSVLTPTAATSPVSPNQQTAGASAAVTVCPDPQQQAPQHDTAVRGFALYVGVTEEQLAAAGTSLTEVINTLKAQLSQLSPQLQSHATLAVAPTAIGGSNIEVTRLALGEPAARRRRKPAAEQRGLVIDAERRRVLVDGAKTSLSDREFELLQFFTQHTGKALSRADIVTHFWAHCTATQLPGQRTVDVYIRRLRAKLGPYQDVIRTVRGSGYCFETNTEVRLISKAG